MSLYALDALDDALDATRSFLGSLDRAGWLELAVVAFFVGGPTAGSNAVEYNAPAVPDAGPGLHPPSIDPGPALLPLVAAIVAVVLVVVLGFLLVGSIMEFVLVESLREGRVTLRRSWGRHWREGVRLFGFRVAIWTVSLGGLAVLGALAFLPLASGAPAVSVLALLLLLPVLGVLAALVGLIDGFTAVFVVPIMLLTGRGVLAGWRRLWASIREEPVQYLAYAVAGFVLSLAGGVLVGLAALVSAVVLLVPFGLLGAVGVALTAAVGPAGWLLAGIAAVLYVAALLLAIALAQAPVLSYLRYYALFVLGDADPDLDLIPERRAAVREP